MFIRLNFKNDVTRFYICGLKWVCVSDHVAQ